MIEYTCERYPPNRNTTPKLMTDMGRRVVSAYLPPDLARRARAHALTTRRSLSSVVAEALDVYFGRLDRADSVRTDA
jgi:hypothetical protein